MERVKLIAPEGMLYTNGVCYGRIVYLGKDDSAEHWHLISQAEYDEREVLEDV